MILARPFFLSLLALLAVQAQGADSASGLYKTTLYHVGSKFYQSAYVTLQASSAEGGKLKLSAQVKLFFGDVNSHEFITYSYPDCPTNFLTGEIQIKDDRNALSLLMRWREGVIEGNWYTASGGEMGRAFGRKDQEPKDTVAVKPVSGTYRGSLVPTGGSSSLPERVAMAIVMQGTGPEASVKFNGTLRFYVGPFGSAEYTEQAFTSVAFDFFTRLLVARAAGGYTLKGTLGHDGSFSGTLFSDNAGELASVDMKKYR